MNCPRDGAVLQKVELAGLELELDKCHKCDGIWCDRGEMEKLRDSQVVDAEEILERKYGDPEVKEGQVEGYMRCPRCPDGRLHRTHYTYKARVAIDRCDSCSGVWLDDGELNAIIGEQKEIEDAVASGKLATFLLSLTHGLDQ